MTTEIRQYIIPLDNLDLEKVLTTWTWLTGDKTIVGLTKTGDALLSDQSGRLYFLNTGYGTLEKKADDVRNFLDNVLEQELIEDLLLPPLVDRLEKSEKMLKPGQVYSYVLLPIIGGKYEEKNMFAVDLYEHFNLTGELQFQLKDSQDGTNVETIVQ